jgi:O-antigen ligase
MLFSCGIVMCLFYVQILSFLLEVATKFGFSGRSIRLFLFDVSHDSGRLEVFNEYLFLIKQRPLFGYGVASWTTGVGGYPHNIILEFLFSFGIILGPILFLICCFLFIKELFKTDSKIQQFYHVVISMLMLLFFSGTFTTNPLFFLALSVCLKKKVV